MHTLEGKENRKTLRLQEDHGENALATSNVWHIIFLAFCILATTFTYFSASDITSQIIAEEYEKISKNNVRTLNKGLEGLQADLKTLLQNNTKNLERNTATQLNETGNGLIAQWNGQNYRLTKASLPKNKYHAHIKSSKDLINTLDKLRKSNDHTSIIIDETTSTNTAYSNRSLQKNANLLFIQKSEEENGHVFAISQSNFKDFWNEFDLLENNIGTLKVYNRATGKTLYNYRRPTDQSLTFSSMFEIKFANLSLEIETGFLPGSKITKLKIIPLFVLFLGGIFTIIGTFAISLFQRNIRKKHTLEQEIKFQKERLENEKEQRKKLGENLETAQQERKEIVDAVSDIIFETDKDGKILFLNAAWKKITGFDIEQCMGTSLFDRLHPEDKETQENSFKLLVQGKKLAYRSFARLRNVDGTFRATEISISMLRHDEKNNLRVVGTLIDVEEHKKAERALSEAEKKYRTIVENAAGGLFQITSEGFYLSANPALARLLGYETQEELLRTIKNVNENLYIEKSERQKIIQEVQALGALHNIESQVKRKDGSIIWINENIHVLKDEHENTLYFEGSIEDITQRKEAEIALKDAKLHSDMANRAKSEFLSNMSHELRTPLNSIIGFSEIIKEETFGKIGKPEYKEYADDIHRSGKNLLKIINQILDISKIDANERQLNEEIINIQTLTTECLDLLKSKISHQRITVFNEIEMPIELIAEKLSVKQIITNLISNAVKFTPEKGHIRIQSQIQDNGDLEISVTDTGVGLDESEIQRALSPFGQVDTVFTKSTTGAGLGLTLVSALMKLHGGKLELVSQKGIGTTVSIIFPAARCIETKETKEIL